MKLKAALLLVTSLAIAGLSASPATSSNYEVSSPPPNGPSPPPKPNGPSPPPRPNGSSPPPPPNGSSPPPPPNGSSPPPPPDGSSPPPPQPPPSKNGILSVEHLYPLKADEGNLLNPRDILLQEIRSFDEDIINEKVQEELGQAIKAEAQKTKTSSASSLPPSNNGSRPPPPPPPAIPTTSTRTSALKELVDAEDLTYIDDPNEDEDDDDEDWDDDDDDNDSFDDEEEILYDQTCPTGCKCGGMYSAATTARCSKLSTEQNFGPSIAHLKIENSDPIQLGPHALREKNLHQLQSLAVVHTSISELDRTAFDGINDLFSINLTGNGLLGIHPDIFQNNTQLSLLTLSENPLQYKQVKSSSDPKYFLDAPSVTELDLTHNALSHLLPTTFAKMPRLVLINLKGNKLRTIDGTIFRSLDQLEELDLSDNQLNGLPADLFADNEYFEILRISGNNLSTLATITATRLESLDASRNRIKIVAKEDLVGLPELEKLDLRSNGLKRIHQHAFVDLFELSYLDISDNRLTSWSEHHLRMNSRLEVLIMNENPALETLPVFKTEDKSGYGVFRFECAKCGLKYLEEGTFDAMPALTRINLAKNSLSSLPKGLFTSLSALRELDLSDNMFAKLEVGMFRGARTLNKLNLAGNYFVTLQVAPFLLTPSLARLDVSRCALERVWSEARMPFTSLRFLSVRGNRLMRITVEELRATPKLSGLDISDNPLACEEEFNDAIEWLQQKGITPTETHKYISNYAIGGDDSEAEGVSQWSDLEAQVCDREDGPPLRPEPRRPNDILPRADDPEDMDPISRKEFDDEQIDHGQDHDDPEDGWPIEDYDIYASTSHPWYSGALWPVITVVLVTLAVVLLVANFAVCIARRRGRGPVIRTPMILRPGLIDNKNCGMVYKPLQEEIATPHMPKRGSFYSSSTFHYDKIVPESV